MVLYGNLRPRVAGAELLTLTAPKNPNALVCFEIVHVARHLYSLVGTVQRRSTKRCVQDVWGYITVQRLS